MVIDIKEEIKWKNDQKEGWLKLKIIYDKDG